MKAGIQDFSTSGGIFQGLFYLQPCAYRGHDVALILSLIMSHSGGLSCYFCAAHEAFVE